MGKERFFKLSDNSPSSLISLRFLSSTEILPLPFVVDISEKEPFPLKYKLIFPLSFLQDSRVGKLINVLFE